VCGNSYYLAIGKRDNILRFFTGTQRCHSYLCPTCRRIKAAEIRRRIDASLQSEYYAMWSLSASKARYATPQGIRDLHHRYHLFLTHLSQLYPSFKYFRISEIGDGGNPHIHMLVNQYLDWPTMHHLWQHYTGGTHCQFERASDSKPGKYLSKYLTKSGATDTMKQEQLFLANIRRFGCSRCYKPLDKIHYDWFKASWSSRAIDPQKFVTAKTEFLNFYTHSAPEILSESQTEITLALHRTHSAARIPLHLLAEQVALVSSSATSAVQQRLFTPD